MECVSWVGALTFALVIFAGIGAVVTFVWAADRLGRR
jgi:hypothetical protein